MNPYGKAFRIIRLIKNISLTQAAAELNIDDHTLRNIEDGKTDIITPRFDQLLEYYHVPHTVIFELAKDQSAFQNVIQTITGESTVVNQNQSPPGSENEGKQTDLLIQQLQGNDRFQKNLIEQLMGTR